MILFHKDCFMPMVYQCFYPVVTTPRYTQIYDRQQYDRRQYDYQQEMSLEAQRTTRFTGGKG
jgi:hypothetical protein